MDAPQHLYRRCVAVQVLAEPRCGVAGGQRYPPLSSVSGSGAFGGASPQCTDSGSGAAQSALQPETVLPASRRWARCDRRGAHGAKLGAAALAALAILESPARTEFATELGMLLLLVLRRLQTPNTASALSSFRPSVMARTGTSIQARRCCSGPRRCAGGCSRHLRSSNGWRRSLVAGIDIAMHATRLRSLAIRKHARLSSLRRDGRNSPSLFSR